MQPTERVREHGWTHLFDFEGGTLASDGVSRWTLRVGRDGALEVTSLN